MVDFNCIGLLELQGPQSERKIQNAKFLLTLVEPVTFRLRSGRTTDCERISDIYRALKSYPHFTWVCYLNERPPHGKCTSMFCRVLHFVNSLPSENIYKKLKCDMTTVQDKLFPMFTTWCR